MHKQTGLNAPQTKAEDAVAFCAVRPLDMARIMAVTALQEQHDDNSWWHL